MIPETMKKFYTTMGKYLLYIMHFLLLVVLPVRLIYDYVSPSIAAICAPIIFYAVAFACIEAQEK